MQAKAREHGALPLAGFLLACLLAPAAAGGPGSAGMQILKTDLSPRALGMGGAFASIADDAYTMDYNPAGLGQMYMPEVSAMYSNGLEGATLTNFVYAMPVPLPGFTGLSKPGAGLSLLMADAGSFDLRLIGAGGAVTEKSYDAQKDMVLSFGYGEKVASDEVKSGKSEFNLDQYLGMNVKYVRSTMLEHYSASALAFDAGWLMMEPRLGLAAAVSLANLGGGLKYDSESTQLPSILRLGLSWQKPTVMDQSLLLAAEADVYAAESRKSLRFGAEYNFEKVFSLRAGYRAMDDNGGITFGLGVHYEDVGIDFATTSGGEVYNTSQVSLSWKFSNVRIQEKKKKMNFKDPPKTRDASKPAGVQPKPAQSRPSQQQKKTDSDFFWLY